MADQAVCPSPADNRLNIPEMVLQRFMRKFQRDSPNGCWNWIGTGTGSGYGAFCAKEFRGAVPAHRLSYKLSYGDIADELHVHHRCGNRRCVNPEHLEAVTALVHKGLDGRTECRNGHPYSEENTRVGANGYNHCRVCEREFAKRSRDRCRGITLPASEDAKGADPLRNMIGLPIPTLRRFIEKIRKDEGSECWFWSASRDRSGYGRFRAKGDAQLAHRLSYELAFGLVPAGHHVHHRCNNPQCVNPAHLEVIIASEHHLVSKNSKASRTHCIWGHEYTPENTAVYQGHRRCKQCMREKGARDYAEYRAAVPKKEHTHCKNGHALSGENLYVVETKRGARSQCKICLAANTKKYIEKDRATFLYRKNKRRRDATVAKHAERDARVLDLIKSHVGSPEELLVKLKAAAQ